MDKHYVTPSRELFDEALAWLETAYCPEGEEQGRTGLDSHL